jgi:hypothetical protein
MYSNIKDRESRESLDWLMPKYNNLRNALKSGNFDYEVHSGGVTPYPTIVIHVGNEDLILKSHPGTGLIHVSLKKFYSSDVKEYKKSASDRKLMEILEFIENEDDSARMSDILDRVLK